MKIHPQNAMIRYNVGLKKRLCFLEDSLTIL